MKHTLLPILFSIAFLTACTSTTDALLDVGSSSYAPTSGENGPRFGDRDPHSWKTDKPWNYPIHGIDISKWQGSVNWVKAKQAGISFVFMKATEGGDRFDSRFGDNWREARQAGVPFGAYHFYYFCTSAAKQAAWFIRNVPKTKGALPPVLDMEWNHKSPSCKLRPPATTVQSEMRVFLKRLTQHYGQKPIIYVTLDFYHENKLGQFKGYEFWLRSVADSPANAYPAQAWSFWQYTGTGKVPGVQGDTDINTFAGSKAQWREWLKARRR